MGGMVMPNPPALAIYGHNGEREKGKTKRLSSWLFLFPVLHPIPHGGATVCVCVHVCSAADSSTTTIHHPRTFCAYRSSSCPRM